MSDPKLAPADDVLAAVKAAGTKHTAALWLTGVVLCMVLAGGGVYLADRAYVSSELEAAKAATDQAVKAASDNEARLQALSDSLAAQSPALKATLNAKLTALGFKAVSK